MIDDPLYTPREIVLDAALIAAIPLVLVAIYFLFPESLHEQFSVDHSNSTFHTLFTAAYIHASVDHLLGNVVGFLIAAGYSYLLCLRLRRRRWFWQTTGALLFVIPIIVNAANVWIFLTYFPTMDGLSRGFSGVVGAFAGFLLVAFVAAVRDEYSGNLAQFTGVSLVLVLLLLISVVYSGTMRPDIGGLVALGVGLQVIGYLYERDWELPDIERPIREIVVQIAGGVLIIGVLMYVVIALFPVEIVQRGVFVNVFAHGIGIILGSITAYLTGR